MDMSKGENNMEYLEPQSPDNRPSRCNLLPIYNQLNQMYFDGELPKIPVVFNGRLQTVYGRCHAIRQKNLVAHKDRHQIPHRFTENVEKGHGS